MKRILSFSSTVKNRGLIPAGLILCGMISTGRAVLLTDNFVYANQAAFEASWPAIGTVAPQSAELSTAQAAGGSFSIRFPGTAVSNQSRNQRAFAETGALTIGDTLVWSFDFYDSAPASNPSETTPTFRTALPLLPINSSPWALTTIKPPPIAAASFIWRVFWEYTVTTVDPDGGPNERVAGTGAFFKLNDFGVGLRLLGWHNLKVEISTDDGLSTDFAFFVDSVLAERVSNVGTFDTIRSYDKHPDGLGLVQRQYRSFYR